MVRSWSGREESKALQSHLHGKTDKGFLPYISYYIRVVYHSILFSIVVILGAAPELGPLEPAGEVARDTDHWYSGGAFRTAAGH